MVLARVPAGVLVVGIDPRAGRLAERADRVLQAAGRYNAQIHVLGELDKTIACDISVATAELGYLPATDLATGMRRAVAWCLERGIAL